MKMSKREQLLLVVLLIGISLYLFNNFLYQPLKADTERLVMENAEMRELIASGQSKVEYSQQLEKEKDNLNQQYQEMMVKIPEQAYIPEAIVFLENSAQEASVALHSINYQAAPTGDVGQGEATMVALQPCDFSIAASGSYFNLMTLLTKIEESPRLYVINSGDINASEKQAEPVPEMVMTLDEETGEMIPVPVPAAPTPTGSARYDADNLTLQLQLTTYFDPASLPGYTGVTETVAPGTGRENPFQG